TMTRTHILAACDSSPVQRLLRVDGDRLRPLSEDARQAVMQMASSRITPDTYIIVSDYDVGVVMPEFLRKLRGRHIIVDTRNSVLKYRRVEMTAARLREPGPLDLCRSQMDNKQTQLFRRDVPLRLGLGVLLARKDSSTTDDTGHLL